MRFTDQHFIFYRLLQLTHFSSSPFCLLSNLNGFIDLPVYSSVQASSKIGKSVVLNLPTTPTTDYLSSAGRFDRFPDFTGLAAFRVFPIFPQCPP